MKIYIAGPYSGANEATMEYRADMYTKLAALLVLDKHYVYSPITMNISIHKQIRDMNVDINTLEYEFWKDNDRQFVEWCDELWVVTVSGWKESVGVFDKVAWAAINRKYIQFVNPQIIGNFSPTNSVTIHDHMEGLR